MRWGFARRWNKWPLLREVLDYWRSIPATSLKYLRRKGLKSGQDTQKSNGYAPVNWNDRVAAFCDVDEPKLFDNHPEPY